MKYDFAGYATRNDIRCSDGRIIRDGAFKECDGLTVPLVWNHDHGSMSNVLGHALLEYRKDGMYTYGKFNESAEGRDAKLRVENGDITSLSIFANQLQQQGPNVLHGAIREVSLVLAGANPGAYIETVMAHGDDEGESAIIYSGEEFKMLEGELELKHADEGDETGEGAKVADNKEASGGKTVGEVFNTLTEEQKKAVYAMIGYLMEEKEGGKKEEEEEVKHNAFDTNTQAQDDVLIHSQLETIIADGKRYGSLKDSFLAHAAEYGIDNIDYLFPEAKNLNTPPTIIDRDTSWVSKVMGGVHHTPFSRIKSMFADITEDEARARGYIKGRLKKEEVFGLLKRSTTPTTIYKKQKLDRDDIIDITDFDVVAWLKSEMRGKLDEEIARAILVGDGRQPSSDDKINEQNIRPIWTDADLYTVKVNTSMSSATDAVKKFIDTCILSRSMYKGSGNPTLFTTEAVLTRCLMLEDGMGYKLYKSVSELATALRVKEIVTVEIMEGLERTPTGGSALNLLGIIVNLNDYNVGADKGGAVNMFDDFDIDYNQQKYLIETRCSGALIKPFSAIVIEGAKSTYNSILSPLYFSTTRTAAIADAGGGGYYPQEVDDNDGEGDNG